MVVDDDVDVHNPTEVEWAVATRFQADLDLVLVTGAPWPHCCQGAKRRLGGRAHLPP